MLNLLPQEAKENLIQNYKIRLGTVIAIFTSSLFIVAIIGLFPTYIREKAETDTLIKMRIEAEEKNSEQSLAEADAMVAKNKVLTDYLEVRIAALQKAPSVTSFIERIFEKRNESINISQIEIDKTLVKVSGVANTRAGLIQFREALRKEADFKSVILPISDLAKSVDADFNITIMLP